MSGSGSEGYVGYVLLWTTSGGCYNAWMVGDAFCIADCAEDAGQNVIRSDFNKCVGSPDADD